MTRWKAYVGVLHSLRDNPLASMFFWTAIASLAGGCAVRSFWKILDLAFSGNLLFSSLGCMAITVGGWFILFALSSIGSAERRGWPTSPYVSAIAIFGLLGFELMNTIL